VGHYNLSSATLRVSSPAALRSPVCLGEVMTTITNGNFRIAPGARTIPNQALGFWQIRMICAAIIYATDLQRHHEFRVGLAATGGAEGYEKR
jgi:hypothetical protein